MTAADHANTVREGMPAGRTLAKYQAALAALDALEAQAEAAEGTISRESAKALIDETGRWEKAYCHARDDLAVAEAERDRLADALAQLREAAAPFAEPKDTTFAQYEALRAALAQTEQTS